LRSAFLLAAVTVAAPAAQPRMSIQELSGFIKVITYSVGEASRGRIDCLDDDVAAQLQKSGVTVDPSAPVAYAENLVQVRTFEAQGKLVICNDKALLKEGATIAGGEGAGKPVIYIHHGHGSQAGGFTLPTPS